MQDDDLIEQVQMERDGKVYFHPEQLKWLEKQFPEVVHSPSSTPEEMYFHSGTRRVIHTIKSKLK